MGKSQDLEDAMEECTSKVGGASLIVGGASRASFGEPDHANIYHTHTHSTHVHTRTLARTQHAHTHTLTLTGRNARCLRPSADRQWREKRQECREKAPGRRPQLRAGAHSLRTGHHTANHQYSTVGGASVLLYSELLV